MAEQDEQAPLASDDAPSDDPAAAGHGNSAAADYGDGTAADRRPPAGPDGRDHDTIPPGAPGPDDYAGLLATLGHYLDRHSPDEVMVLLRAEMDRRETAAYASGWRDAAACYEPALAEARAASGRTPRPVRRTPGQAVVIPLRREGPEAAGRGAGDARGNGGDGRDPDARAGSAGRPAQENPRQDRQPATTPPALVPKSPSSRAPTIPRLRTNRRRPADGGHAGTPDGDAL
ncbi:hypothetical protein [Streptomyces lancefieldiae]|uniref:Uncharacterized protein n=1 Tax=Streptomyces lancefieldiae TaxID=3075520 RepID=A0ABU3AIV4_9ACTN|nr:hypothetical protein [Streptomyces sp. DSM 40712]MDT0610118.1 hypothetical protein [Streptomyces sp. DSM 40712]